MAFESLSISEASLKHDEREFCLAFCFHHKDGRIEKSGVRTSAFYACSHKKVLTRRSMFQCEREQAREQAREQECARVRMCMRFLSSDHW